MTVQRLAALDRSLSSRLVLPPGIRPVRLAARLLAHSGDSLLWLFGAGIAIFWSGGLCRQIGWRILAGTLTAGVIVGVLKWTFRRRRPPADPDALYAPFDRHGFPSGHAGRSACVIVLLLPLLSAGMAVILVLWACLLGLARVSLEVHFLSDVLGGWLVGLIVGMLLTIVI